MVLFVEFDVQGFFVLDHVFSFFFGYGFGSCFSTAAGWLINVA